MFKILTKIVAKFVKMHVKIMKFKWIIVAEAMVMKARAVRPGQCLGGASPP